MMMSVICIGAVLGAVLGAASVLVFGASLLVGVGLYFLVTLTLTCYGIFSLLFNPPPDDRMERAQRWAQ